MHQDKIEHEIQYVQNQADGNLREGAGYYKIVLTVADAILRKPAGATPMATIISKRITDVTFVSALFGE